LFLALSVVAIAATAESVQSIGQMTFADANTVIIAGWWAGEIHALHFAPAGRVAPEPFNLKNISASIARALRTHPENLRFEDMALPPLARNSPTSRSRLIGATGSHAQRWCRLMRPERLLSFARSSQAAKPRLSRRRPGW